MLKGAGGGASRRTETANDPRSAMPERTRAGGQLVRGGNAGSAMGEGVGVGVVLTAAYV